MTDTEVKKRRQHHVWQHYLKSWTAGGQLYCLIDNRIFSTGTTAVAVEEYFYKLEKLTDKDVALIRFLLIDVPKIHPLTRRLHEEFLALVASPAQWDGLSPVIDELLDTHRTNALENYHAGIEASFMPLLERALNRDIGFYSDDDGCRTFSIYAAEQHMRTKGIRERTIDILKSDGLDASRIWGPLSHMLATNIGMSVYFERRRRKLVLIENTTVTEFVTGDQPIINLAADRKSAPDSLVWYYPISPRLALNLTGIDQEPTFTTSGLRPEHVEYLNARVAAASHRQVFARSKISLEPFAHSKP